MSEAMKAVGPEAAMTNLVTDLRALARWAGNRILILLGLALVIVGLPIAITPIPVGLPMVAIGLVILLNTSTRAKRLFVRWRRRYPETGGRVREFIRRRRR